MRKGLFLIAMNFLELLHCLVPLIDELIEGFTKDSNFFMEVDLGWRVGTDVSIINHD